MSFGVSFQINKVNRLIQTNGQTFLFKRRKKNEFNEPIKEESEEISIVGFYHETSSYVSKTTSEGTVYRSERVPMILCSIEEGNKVRRNDILNYANKEYEVVDLTDVNELGICYEISLEVIQDGKQG